MDNTPSFKQIILYVNDSASSNLPDDIANWTPDDTELILSVGSAALKRAKQIVGGMQNKSLLQEMRKALQMQYDADLKIAADRLEQTERELILQKERAQLQQDEQESVLQRRLKQSKDIFEEILDSFRKERDEMRSRIAYLENELRNSRQEFDGQVHREALNTIQHEIDTMRKMLSEKDKQVDTHKELLDKSIQKFDTIMQQQQQKRDVASIGKIGESQFRGLAQSIFRDFDGFQLREVCAIGGLGDFHMQFKDFTILVDSKLYTNKVNSTSRDKIRRDLLNNDHIQFAWLVSMDTLIDRFDKAPFMFEWVNSQKCVCYINCLMKQEEPGELLRSVWYCCKALKQMMETEGTERGELSVLKERELRMRDIVGKMVKANRERDTIFGQMRQNFDRTDEYIRELLNEETAVVMNDFYRVVVEWWNHNLEEIPATEPQTSLKSTVVWTQFKRMVGKDECANIDANTFKDILCGFLGEDRIIKPKVRNGALELRGIRWKDGAILLSSANKPIEVL